jgi:Zn finger protein HypA/HybF involved in hydrogenase expression
MNDDIEFKEIPLSGGKIEFIKKGKGVSMRYTGSNPVPLKLFTANISRDGVYLIEDRRTLVQIKDNHSFVMHENPLPAYIISDNTGMLGRNCPKCESYFRTDWYGMEDTHCPYCPYHGHKFEFMTKNQLNFLEEYRKTFLEAFKQEGISTIDLDEVINKLPDNKPNWFYAEEKQQLSIKCPGCETHFDILGIYGKCPKCNNSNHRDMINLKLDALRSQFVHTEETMTDRHIRESEWKKLLSFCVSEFEALAVHLRKQLIRIPATPKRKSDLFNLSFQNILKANNCFLNWFGFEILNDIPNEDRDFMNKMFNRRHLIIHKAGEVDQEYLNNTEDRSVKLRQVIRIRSTEIRRLLPLIRKAATSLIDGIESIV